MTTQRKRTREWTIIVAAAILFHAVLFFSIRPGFFTAFKKTVADDASPGPSRPFGTNAIVTIAIEIDDQPQDATEQNLVQQPNEVATEPRKQQLERPASPRGSPDDEALDVESLTGRSPQTLPQKLGPQGLIIPPRPIEITWPDTRNLRHCLGHNIDVRIEVDERGKVLNVEALGGDHPSDCARAAVESAQRIVFEPGEIDGVATPMWTQIRIEFRKKR